MCGFGLADLDQVVYRLLAEAEGGEVGDWEAGEALAVEGGFEMLESESTVIDMLEYDGCVG